MAKSSSSKNTAQTTTRARRAAGPSARSLAQTRNRSREPFAVTCGGSVFVNIDELATIDPAGLKDRKLFIGAELGRGERRLAQEVLGNAGHELGARIAGPLTPRRAARAKPE